MAKDRPAKRGYKEMRDDNVPPLVEWFAGQHLNSDPVRAEAAKYTHERFGFSNGYNHARVLRTLANEQSPYLHGLRLLTEDYADQFGMTGPEQFEHVGVISPLVPVTREQCGHNFKTGKVCDRDAVPGTGFCGYHGGQWITDEERTEVVGKIAARLVDVSDRAVTVLEDLMDHARSEKVRFDAAIAIIDRIGLSPVTKVELDVTPAAEKAAEEVRGRLLKLAARDGNIVRGTLVSPNEDTPFPELVDGAGA